MRDRVVQAAVLLILEPIFEADFEDCSYGFRPGRSAHQALRTIHQHLKDGYSAVYDADLAGYFDSIPHDKLIACVRMRVADGSVIGLLRQWLNAPVVEPPKDKGQPPTVQRNRRGTPQGGVLSPLLANIYLHWFDRAFHRPDGPAQWANAKLVRYADDFVVLARYISPRLQHFIEDKLEGWLGLQINRDKTRTLDLRQPGQSLDFLGYTFRYDRDRLGRDKRYWNLTPSCKALTRERAVLHEKIGLSRCHVPLPELITHLNRHLRGYDLSAMVQGDKATLTGEVEDAIAKELAEQIALGVDGIKRVDNKIEVEADYAHGKHAARSERSFGDKVNDDTQC